MGQRDSNAPEISQMEHWYVENLRVTSFPIEPPDEQDDILWWKELIGGQPDHSHNIRQISGKQDEGVFGTGKLVLTVQPVRIDWVYTVSIDQDTDTIGIATLGSFSEALGKFMDLINRWFKVETCPNANRVAFAAILMQHVENPQDGYSVLKPYLPNVNLEFEKEASDFIYQINRPIDSHSGITGLKINRLANWSIANLFLMKSWLNPVMASPRILQTQKYFACRLELDINTAADFSGKLECEKLSDIFNELVAIGQEIANKGDIK